jgi:hypothetical protein
MGCLSSDERSRVGGSVCPTWVDRGAREKALPQVLGELERREQPLAGDVDDLLGRHRDDDVLVVVEVPGGQEGAGRPYCVFTWSTSG